MDESDRHLKITSSEWNAFMDDLQQSFDKVAVPLPEQEELRAIVQSTRNTTTAWHDKHRA
jgi:hypothetical protein